MNFLSYEFLGFMLILACLYYLIPRRFQWQLLLAASLIFYMSHGIKYMIFIFITGISIFGTALAVEKGREAIKQEIKRRGLQGKEKKAFQAKKLKKLRWVLLAGVWVNLGIFIVIKYTNFGIWNWNQIQLFLGREEVTGPVNWLLPLGISYYTLQAFGYLLDVWHGTEKAERNFFRLLLFLCFFPQMIQGPISKFGVLKKTLYGGCSWSWERVRPGLERILWGCFKKLVVADRVASVVRAVGENSQEFSGVYVLVGMFAYTLQLYGDFTGGIDIALGSAKVFGIELPENFQRPFGAESLAEYWRRWHMTLMQWFREYVFYPLAGSRYARAVSKAGQRLGGKSLSSKLPVYLVSLVTWFLTGIWHGASWNFVIWGLVNCMILLVSQEAAPLYRTFHRKFAFSNTGIYRKFMAARTLFLVSAVQMFEYYPSPKEALAMFADMLTHFQISRLFDGSWEGLGISLPETGILLICVICFCLVSSVQKKEQTPKWVAEMPEWVRFASWSFLFAAVLVFGAYGQGYDASQFIYNQF